jgi:hypothetical protein
MAGRWDTTVPLAQHAVCPYLRLACTTHLDDVSAEIVSTVHVRSAFVLPRHNAGIIT